MVNSFVINDEQIHQIRIAFIAGNGSPTRVKVQFKFVFSVGLFLNKKNYKRNTVSHYVYVLKLGTTLIMLVVQSKLRFSLTRIFKQIQKIKIKKNCFLLKCKPNIKLSNEIFVK